MKTFVGTKMIKARPMNLGEYNLFKGWKIPTDENPKTPGYLVGYSRANGEFDGPWEEGCDHLSWTPQDVFEATYREGRMPAKTTEALQNELLEAEIEKIKTQTQLVKTQIEELKMDMTV